MEQLFLGFKSDRDLLKSYFEQSSGLTVELTITDNSTRMVSFKTEGERIHLRLHRIFLEAGKDVIGEVARFIKRRRCRTPLIRHFIAQRSSSLRTSRRIKARTAGRHYDLLEIYEAINREYFEGRVCSSITWGRRGCKGRVRRRTLGSYGPGADVIRINPALDSPEVPGYFVEFIVYHEMLHAFMGVGSSGKRRSVHSREFRKREREFRFFEKAVEWERKNPV